MFIVCCMIWSVNLDCRRVLSSAGRVRIEIHRQIKERGFDRCLETRRHLDILNSQIRIDIAGQCIPHVALHVHSVLSHEVVVRVQMKVSGARVESAVRAVQNQKPLALNGDIKWIVGGLQTTRREVRPDR